MIKITTNQLMALKRAHDDTRGIIAADRSTTKGLVSKQLAAWSTKTEDEAFITDAGMAVIAGLTPFKLSGDSTFEMSNMLARQLARKIVVKGRHAK